MNDLSPICLFTYNRLDETQQTVVALQQNLLVGESELFVFSDGSRNDQGKPKVQAVREFIHTIKGFKSVTIIESEINLGLANSIISGVSRMLEKYKNVIVLEDDLITSPNFMNFMNQGLDFYQHAQNVESISAYSLSLKDKSKAVYFQTRPGSWGWATWKDRWNPDIFDKEKIKNEISSDVNVLNRFKRICGADMSKMLMGSVNNQNDSWYVRWAFDHYRNNKYSVFPTYSYIQNIGFSVAGTHCKGINTYISAPVDEQLIDIELPEFKMPDPKTDREFLYYFSRRHKIIERFKLLKTTSGRSRLMNEFRNRTKLFRAT